MPDYFFGLYHWRRRVRSLLLGLLGVAIGIGVARRGRRCRQIAGGGLAIAGVYRAIELLRSLLVPPPWTVERYKYDALADALPVADADSLLDCGCGTGRSLVGLAARVPDDCRVVGLDVFDDRIILGNGPKLAERNGDRAGLDVRAVRGDATALPVADNSQDVVTACRLLHDLPARDARACLAECRRVCKPGGAVGVLELPITHEGKEPPAEYWPALVASAGFDVEEVEQVPRRRSDDSYTVVVGRPVA